LKTIGRHLIAEYYDCDFHVLDDVDTVRRAMLDAATAVGATVIGEAFHRFEPQGLSGTVVIAESHLSIHTWPELGYAAIDLFTCGDSCDPRVGCEVLAERFTAEQFDMETVQRGGSGKMRFLPRDSALQRKESPCPVPN